MINSTYLYLFISSAVVFSLLFIFLNFKPNKSNVSNKMLLRNLLEGFDLEIPDELKRLDNSTTDPHKLL
tara:strand:+ start:119 stop:325 length:207 start_codon:yes stop_codon:yes gene_type:complete